MIKPSLWGNSKPVILLAGNTRDNIASVSAILEREYQVQVATNGKMTLKMAHITHPDIIVMDAAIPEPDGYAVCARLKQTGELRDIPIVFLAFGGNEADEKKGLAAGAADYIIGPVSPTGLSLRIRTQLLLKQSRDIIADQDRFLDEEVHRRTREMTLIQEASIMALAALAEMRDNETGAHLRRAKLYVKELAEYMGKTKKYRHILTPEKIRMIVLSAPMHDIGKVGISDRILRKKGKLSAAEYETMKTHTVLGRDAILNAERWIGEAETFLTCAREIAYSHHEKWDGSGYPQALSGEDIPLSARLMAVADVYDALTSRRIYKEAISHDAATEIIRQDAGKHFDPDVVDAFLAIKDRFQAIAVAHREP